MARSARACRRPQLISFSRKGSSKGITGVRAHSVRHRMVTFDLSQKIGYLAGDRRDFPGCKRPADPGIRNCAAPLTRGG